jgi:shikimate kinase
MIAQTIYLCGFMGVGKTTIGRHLSAALNYRFSDLDHLIEEGEGYRVTEIFGRYGEPYFRDLEYRYLLAHSKRTRQILALGGGTLQNQQIIDLIKKHGVLIFLQLPTESIVQRLRYTKKRPLLLRENGERRTIEELEEFITDLYNKRLPSYLQADILFSIDPNWKVDVCVRELSNAIDRHERLGTR